MKTEKEIRDRLEIHNQRLTKLDGELSQEQMKYFPNRGLIARLRKLIEEENAAIVYLSWVII